MNKKYLIKVEKQINRHLSRSAKRINSLLFITKEFYKIADNLKDIYLDNTPGVSFDCKVGCSFCCNIRAEVLPVEAILIATELKNNSNNLTEIMNKLSKHSNDVKGITLGGHDNICPFLNEKGICTIYDFRPYQCRTYFSGDVSKCQKGEMFQEAGWMQLKALAGKIFIEALARRGYSVQPAELGTSVYSLLIEEDLIDNWLVGNQIFKNLPEYI